jgi:branched-chain amino acid transport system permease protein
MIPGGFQDKQPIVTRRFDEALLDRLRALDLDALIAEYRESVAGPYSDDLLRLLIYLRRTTARERCVIFAARPFAEYRLVVLSDNPSVAPRPVEGEVYGTADEAQHAVFVRRVREAMRK